MYGHLASTYESASTRRYRHGRVDNIRGATIQALEIARSLSNKKGGSKKARLVSVYVVYDHPMESKITLQECLLGRSQHDALTAGDQSTNRQYNCCYFWSWYRLSSTWLKTGKSRICRVKLKYVGLHYYTA